MSPTAIGVVVFTCTFGGALAGLALRLRLPDHHVSKESRDTVKAGIGLIATMTALVLGIITGSAKSSFDDVNAAIKRVSADLIALDRTLVRYGPETAPLREAIRNALVHRMEAVWPADGSDPVIVDPSNENDGVEMVAARIQRLVPQTEEQRSLQSRAVELAESILQTRLLIFEDVRSGIPVPFLIILIFWLTVTFASFGVFAPRNATVIIALFLSALSVAAAVFLVLEMDGPFEGLIKVSSDPLTYALSHMSQ